MIEELSLYLINLTGMKLIIRFKINQNQRTVVHFFQFPGLNIRPDEK